MTQKEPEGRKELGKYYMPKILALGPWRKEDRVIRSSFAVWKVQGQPRLYGTQEGGRERGKEGT